DTIQRAYPGEGLDDARHRQQHLVGRFWFAHAGASSFCRPVTGMTVGSSSTRRSDASAPPVVAAVKPRREPTTVAPPAPGARTCAMTWVRIGSTIHSGNAAK